jgi:regulatory protein
MPTITALETQQHDPERVNVYLDGRFAFGVSRMVAVARRLSEGLEVDGDLIEAAMRDDAVERAYGAALNFLSFRPRSHREIRDYFRKKQVEPDVVLAVTERLERTGLIDDREFARFWVDNRQTFRPRGTRALKAEMRQKGLDGEVIDEALEGLGDEEETAYRAGQKKARSLAASDEREFFRSMLGFLQRRGFPYPAASAAARRLYNEAASRTASGDLEDTLPVDPV